MREEMGEESDEFLQVRRGRGGAGAEGRWAGLTEPYQVLSPAMAEGGDGWTEVREVR